VTRVLKAVAAEPQALQGLLCDNGQTALRHMLRTSRLGHDLVVVDVVADVAAHGFEAWIAHGSVSGYRRSPSLPLPYRRNVTFTFPEESAHSLGVPDLVPDLRVPDLCFAGIVNRYRRPLSSTVRTEQVGNIRTFLRALPDGGQAIAGDDNRREEWPRVGCE
jgi:hypothetical protein